MSKAHPGFQAVQAKIAAKEGIPKANAGAILASASRKASPAAKKANPNLKKVRGAGDNREGRLHEIKTSRGNFHMKDNRKGES